MSKLLGYVHRDYEKSEPTKEVLYALEQMWAASELGVEDFKEQLRLTTATWGLILWEAMYGITPEPNQSIEARRLVVQARILGSGTTTINVIKEVCENYVGGEVNVVEHNDQYKFVVFMVGVIGTPPNLDELKKTIKEIKPAHLDFEIVFRYNTYGDLKDMNLTYGYLKSLGLTYEELRSTKIPPMPADWKGE